MPTNQRFRCECIVSCIIGYPNILEQSNKKQQKLGFVPANFIKVDQNEGKSEKIVKMTTFQTFAFFMVPQTVHFWRTEVKIQTGYWPLITSSLWYHFPFFDWNLNLNFKLKFYLVLVHCQVQIHSRAESLWHSSPPAKANLHQSKHNKCSFFYQNIVAKDQLTKPTSQRTENQCSFLLDVPASLGVTLKAREPVIVSAWSVIMFGFHPSIISHVAHPDLYIL